MLKLYYNFPTDFFLKNYAKNIFYIFYDKVILFTLVRKVCVLYTNPQTNIEIALYKKRLRNKHFSH